MNKYPMRAIVKFKDVDYKEKKCKRCKGKGSFGFDGEGYAIHCSKCEGKGYIDIPKKAIKQGKIVEYSFDCEKKLMKDDSIKEEFIVSYWIECNDGSREYVFENDILEQIY